MQSRPVKAIGINSDWIGLGVSYPAAVTALRTFETVEEEFEHSLVVLQRVLDFPTPISDFAPEMIAAVSSLKRLHAALSQQQHGGEDMRGIIASRLPETLEYLTR